MHKIVTWKQWWRKLMNSASLWVWLFVTYIKCMMVLGIKFRKSTIAFYDFNIYWWIKVALMIHKSFICFAWTKWWKSLLPLHNYVNKKWWVCFICRLSWLWAFKYRYQMLRGGQVALLVCELSSIRMEASTFIDSIQKYTFHISLLFCMKGECLDNCRKCKDGYFNMAVKAIYGFIHISIAWYA